MPLVAEAVPDLVDPVESPDDQALVVQLQGDAHGQVEIQGVMVRGRKAGRVRRPR